MNATGVLYEKAGACGLITLDRPKALNALTVGMVEDIGAALDRFEADPDITSVAIKSASSKAFCAGGDIRLLHDLGKAGQYEEQLRFWREEYRLNRRIKFYPKPYLALVDGIVMGGGAGLSLHGSFVVAGARFTFAMPEAGIGFFPDVGATYFLPRLPFHSGIYLALTGARLDCGDANGLGLASGYVPAGRHAHLLERLINGEPADRAVLSEQSPPPASKLLDHRALITRCFAAETLPEILHRLDDEASRGSEFASAAAKAVRAKSPTSLAIALRQMQIGARLTLTEALRTEYRIAARIARGHDYYEGVRALIIDKDNSPHWDPAIFEAVAPAAIDNYFAPLASGELDFGDTLSTP